MKTCFVFLLLLFLAADIALAQLAKSPVKPKSFELASNQFAVNLWQKLSKENDQKLEPENYFFSPYSIFTALSMVYFGANQNTAAELKFALQLGLTEVEDKRALADMVRKSSEVMFGQADTTKAYNLSSANGLAIDNKFTILDSYKKTIVEKFLGQLFSVDFVKESPGATERINKWIAEKTNNKIGKLFQEPLSTDTVMVLINAVYFKGNWSMQFDTRDTFKAPFFIKGNHFDNVTFMSKKSRFNYTNNQEANLEMVELPYVGDDISMYAFLPKSIFGNFEQMKKDLNASFIEKLIEQKRKNKITLHFPKFNLDSEFDLKPTLNQMGVKDLFGGTADLSGISEQSNIAVSSVRHKAKIEVNEEGSEAAAVTTITFVPASYVPEYVVRFDSPFVFVIRHNGNGQLLFVGEVRKF